MSDFFLFFIMNLVCAYKYGNEHHNLKEMQNNISNKPVVGRQEVQLGETQPDLEEIKTELFNGELSGICLVREAAP